MSEYLAQLMFADVNNAFLEFFKVLFEHTEFKPLSLLFVILSFFTKSIIQNSQR